MQRPPIARSAAAQRKIKWLRALMCIQFCALENIFALDAATFALVVRISKAVIQFRFRKSRPFAKSGAAHSVISEHPMCAGSQTFEASSRPPPALPIHGKVAPQSDCRIHLRQLERQQSQSSCLQSKSETGTQKQNLCKKRGIGGKGWTGQNQQRQARHLFSTPDFGCNEVNLTLLRGLFRHGSLVSDLLAVHSVIPIQTPLTVGHKFVMSKLDGKATAVRILF